LYTYASPPPPANPDIKRELKKHLLSMSPRSFEFFAGDFLVYIGLEAIAVTRYIGDGGIDAHGDLIAGRFRIPTGVQVKRHRNNVQRPDIDKFIGALSGRFSQGMFMTTASYAPGALQKASNSIPRILTLNGDQIISVMIEHSLGLKSSASSKQNIAIDPDYFSSFEAMKSFLSQRVSESPHEYHLSTSSNSASETEQQTVEITPENDLISATALGYALRVDPVRVRRWVENQELQPDGHQTVGGRSNYYFRRDRIEHIRATLGLGKTPVSLDEWKQQFLDFAKSRNLSRSYKPVMVKSLFKLADREGKVNIDDLAREFKDYYVQRLNAGQPLEQDASLMAHPAEANHEEIKRLLIAMPIHRFLIKNFITDFPQEGFLQIAPQIWQELHYYEVVDVLKSADEQINYYIARHTKR